MSKVDITISLDDQGRVNFKTTSQNLVTLLGMLELAKKIVNDSQKSQKEPNVVPARFSNGFK